MTNKKRDAPNVDGWKAAEIVRALFARIDAIENKLDELEDEFIVADVLGASGGSYADQFESHPDNQAVDRFAIAMKSKLAKKRDDGRDGWQECSAEFLSDLLREHVEKGDPVDVANIAMMLHQTGQVIIPVDQPEAATDAEKEDYKASLASATSVLSAQKDKTDG